MKGRTNKFQRLTDTIAQRGGLQLDNRQYFDPIHISFMEGGFIRNLKRRSYPHVKILFGIIFFTIPGVIWAGGLGGGQDWAVLPGILLFMTVYMATGTAIIFSGIKDIYERIDRK